MNPKPGWKTTEFWKGLLVQVVAICALLGVIPNVDQTEVSGQLTAMVGMIAALLTSASQFWMYLRGRLMAKGVIGNPAPTPDPVALAGTSHVLAADAPARKMGMPSFIYFAIIGSMAMGFLAGSVSAQPFLPWRHQLNERIKFQEKLLQELAAKAATPAAPASDPALLAAMQRLADNQAALLAEMRRAVPATPPLAAATPSPIIHYYIPIDGAPKIALPIDGKPKVPLPIDGAPKVSPPIDGTPKVPLPLDGAPKVPLGVDRPPIVIPGDLAPGVAKPFAFPSPAPASPPPSTPIPPILAPAPSTSVPPPAGYRRFTSSHVTLPAIDYATGRAIGK